MTKMRSIYLFILATWPMHSTFCSTELSSQIHNHYTCYLSTGKNDWNCLLSFNVPCTWFQSKPHSSLLVNICFCKQTIRLLICRHFNKSTLTEWRLALICTALCLLNKHDWWWPKHLTVCCASFNLPLTILILLHAKTWKQIQKVWLYTSNCSGSNERTKLQQN